VQFQRENYERIAPDPTRWPKLFAKATRIQWDGLSTQTLKNIAAPVLVMAGDHDVLGAPVEHAFDVARTIPGGQFAVIPDAGHFVVYESPEKVMPVVSAFFAAPAEKAAFATTLTGYHPGETQ
jgi:pimeloyl-ACP methyl ester carboxylesterase